ncbi:MAG: hypothetical protein IBX43_10525 [Campylobacterales bacterium]|nr:hypothetical protein [Campylobacterales bacterium]
MKKHDLEFCFKGNRTYVHGTDIYNKMIEFIKDIKDNESFDCSFHGVAKTNLEISEQKPEDENKLKFACKYTDTQNNKKIIYGIENNKKIECRYEYPEEDICKLTNLDLKNQEISLEESSSYTFVENSVALNKYLLENLFPNANGKWYFTRFQLKEIPDKNHYPLKLVLKANFNFKLTKTEVFIDNRLIGYIYFSLV